MHHPRSIQTQIEACNEKIKALKSMQQTKLCPCCEQPILFNIETKITELQTQLSQLKSDWVLSEKERKERRKKWEELQLKWQELQNKKCLYNPKFVEMVRSHFFANRWEDNALDPNLERSKKIAWNYVMKHIVDKFEALTHDFCGHSTSLFYELE